jgi:hypothetical protein
MAQGFFYLLKKNALIFLKTSISMSTITPSEMFKNTTFTTKFDTLTFSKNGFLLKYRNEPEIEILFAELYQIYTK